MRGAAVDAGTHRLVYRYEPLSFRLGACVSAASIALGLVLAFRATRAGGISSAIGRRREYPGSAGIDPGTVGE